MDNHEKTQTKNSRKKRIIIPSFYIDEERRVICDSHSEIGRIRVLSSLSEIPAFEEIHEIEKLLTCKSCLHYRNDDCYFPKSEIDRIEQDRLSYTFHCKLCGGSIERPLTIMYSLYNKERFNVQIPTVCCSCFSNLDNDSYLSNTRRRIILFSFSFIFSIFLIFYYGRVIFASSIVGVLLLGATLLFWAIMAIRDVRNIIFLVRGRKYYKKTYGLAKEREKGKYVDDFPFD